MTQQRLGFIGVTASDSAINTIFPAWARTLGLADVRLDPVDLPLATPPERYRAVVRDIMADPAHRGALVTSHKVRLLQATADMFDELDPFARLAGEVSCISKRGGRLRGHAKDPITSGSAMSAFVPPGHFAGGADVLCFGAGGAGLAILLHLASRPQATDRPGRVVLVNDEPQRLDDVRRRYGRLAGPAPAPELVTHVNTDPRANDRLLDTLAPGSLVINATGMGKDLPGSPITHRGRFPHRGLVWELNYRGELGFLHQARQQQATAQLHIEDGWRYFIHGWSAVIEEVFTLGLDTPTVERLSAVAAESRKEEEP